VQKVNYYLHWQAVSGDITRRIFQILAYAEIVKMACWEVSQALEIVRTAADTKPRSARLLAPCGH